ncbi:hypothetical protein EIP91_005445 [Steccherinum ochraceum]|uniref:Uncharacterized protein n=1 Tax=Steccherinum ochraceum TaxID=92696 RepID=A0A4R0RZ48_9APHY|nr:hypothetical protein EIP91_005445 [Steccherinum ochraceum]
MAQVVTYSGPSDTGTISINVQNSNNHNVPAALNSLTMIVSQLQLSVNELHARLDDMQQSINAVQETVDEVQEIKETVNQLLSGQQHINEGVDEVHGIVEAVEEAVGGFPEQVEGIHKELSLQKMRATNKRLPADGLLWYPEEIPQVRRQYLPDTKQAALNIGAVSARTALRVLDVRPLLPADTDPIRVVLHLHAFLGLL